jgi:hypothetical protein
MYVPKLYKLTLSALRAADQVNVFYQLFSPWPIMDLAALVQRENCQWQLGVLRSHAYNCNNFYCFRMLNISIAIAVESIAICYGLGLGVS